MPECGFGTKGCREKHCCVAAASAPPPLPLLPPLPPAMPTSPSASPLRLAEHVSAINRRFRRSPHDIQWAFDGSLADAAVLVHIFDRWEYHDNDGYQYWRADLAHRPQLSCSLIYAEQRPAISPNIPIPVYGNGVGSYGVVLRPGRTTRIACGTGAPVRTLVAGRAGSAARPLRRPGATRATTTRRETGGMVAAGAHGILAST